MNIKDAYIHNGSGVVKDLQVTAAGKLQLKRAEKTAQDAYDDWHDVYDFTTFKAVTAGTADKVAHKLTFTGGVTGDWDGSDAKTVAIPTKSSWNYDDAYVKLDAGTTEQTIKNSIGNLSNGSIEIWRATSGGYPMIGFATGTTKTKLGFLGFGTTANEPIFRTTAGVDNKLYHAGNLTIGTLMGSTAIGDSDEPVYWSGSAFTKCGPFASSSHDHDSTYVKLSSTEQTIESTIGTFSKGIVEFYRSSGDHIAFITFSNKVNNAKRVLGSIGFYSGGTGKLQYRSPDAKYYDIVNGNNVGTYISGSNVTLSTSAQTLLTIKSGESGNLTSTNITVQMPATDPYTSARIPTEHNHDGAYVQQKALSVPSDYIDFVILLCKVDNTNTSANYYCGGTIYLKRSNILTNIMQRIDFFVGKEYNKTQPIFGSVQVSGGLSTQLVTCTYNSVPYAALYIKVTASCYYWSKFYGVASNLDDVQTVSVYKHQGNTPEILNAEVYNSIAVITTDELPITFYGTPKVTTDKGTTLKDIYHKGNLTIKTLMGNSAIGDSDEPVYWNGTSFTKANAYPTKASWNYDDVYLKDLLLDTGNSTDKDKTVSLTNGNVYLKLFKTVNGAEAEDSKVKIYGATNVSVTTDSSGDIKITGVDAVTTATNATNATYAANVGAAGTENTNYVTAAHVISMYNWYNTITATDDASNTAIDKWNEIISFLAGVTDDKTLSGLLAGKANSSHNHNASDINDGTLGVARGGTGLGTIGIYSILYASAANTLSALAPNTSSTKKFLRMTGDDTNGATPAWDTVTKSDVGLGNVENTALSTWTGSSNITTLGTITTGTWGATAIAVNKGGTGKTSWTKNGIIYASDTTTLAQIGVPSTASKTYWLKCVTNASSNPTYSFAELSKSDVGLGNVDNTADADKSVNYATSAGDATTLSGYGYGSFAMRRGPFGQGSSYRRTVIALCTTSTKRDSTGKYSLGRLTFHRVNGLTGSKFADVFFEDTYNYNVDNTFNYSIFSNCFNPSTEPIAGVGIRACRFMYQGQLYGGVEFFFDDAETNQNYFVGDTNFGIFYVDYYQRAYGNVSAQILNSEIYNSITYSSDYCKRLHNTYQAAGFKHIDYNSNAYVLTSDGGATQISNLAVNTATALTTDAGGTANPVYFSGGIPVACSSTVGSLTKPAYMNAGTISECTYSLSADLNAGTGTRLAYYSGANAISSGNIVTDGTYIANVSYLTINDNSQTDYRLKVNGSIGANSLYLYESGAAARITCEDLSASYTQGRRSYLCLDPTSSGLNNIGVGGDYLTLEKWSSGNVELTCAGPMNVITSSMSVGYTWLNGQTTYKLGVNGSFNATSIYLNGTALSSASTHAHGDYVTSVGTSGNTLTWEKGGVAQTAITVPFATKSKQLNDDATAPFVHRQIGETNGQSYYYHVVLLVATQRSNNWSGQNFIDGHFFFYKSGGNVYDVVNVNINQVWQSLEYHIDCYGQDGLYTLCRCTYNGVEYYALKCPYHANPFTSMIFTGTVCSDLVGENVVLPKDIAYKSDYPSANTVLNQDVYNSLTDELSSTYVTSVSHRQTRFGNGIITHNHGVSFSGYDNNYVLTAGGSAKAISDFLLKTEIVSEGTVSETVTKSLINSSWIDAITLPETAGSYMICLTSGNSTLTGVFSVGTSDGAKDEITLHLHGNGPRLFARTNGTKLQISSNDAEATSRSVTIKYKRMI